jgi:hypothetical protein
MLNISKEYKTELLKYFQKDTYCTEKKLSDLTYGFSKIPHRTKSFLKNLTFEENFKLSSNTLFSSHENNKHIIENFFLSLEAIYGTDSRDIFLTTNKGEKVNHELDTDQEQVKVIKQFLLKKYSNMYKNFRGLHGKRVIEQTGENICPYCYRSYVNVSESEDGTKAVTPDLDHFFPKSRYPFLSVTLSNLIPSCLFCNQRAKNDEDFYKASIYPPQKIFDNIEFDYDIYLNKIYIKNYKDLISNPAYAMHLKTFLIQETYATHTEILKNIINKYRKYRQSKIEDLIKHTIGLSAFETKKIVFYEYEFMNKKRELMFKLKKDLYKKIVK